MQSAVAKLKAQELTAEEIAFLDSANADQLRALIAECGRQQVAALERMVTLEQESTEYTRRALIAARRLQALRATP